MLYTDALTPVALELLKGIQHNPIFADTRLVGGTALALQIGHRKSIDLDFFGHVDLLPAEMELELQTYGTVSRRGVNRRIQGYMVAEVQVDFVDYPYAWLAPSVEDDGLRLAACRDIAAMKLSAITNRGSKKDFIDLLFLLEMFTLSEMLDFYQTKFADGGLFPVIKSLVFFDDAEEDPMPEMLKPCDWHETKRRIVAAVTALN